MPEKIDLMLFGAVIMVSLLWANSVPMPAAGPDDDKAMPELAGAPISQAEELNEIYQRLQAQFAAPKNGAPPQPANDAQTGSASAQQATSWRLMGLVNKDEGSYALIEQDKKIDRYRPGATLPDGSTLLSIGKNSMETAADQQKRQITLYGTNTQPLKQR